MEEVLSCFFFCVYWAEVGNAFSTSFTLWHSPGTRISFPVSTMLTWDPVSPTGGAGILDKLTNKSRLPGNTDKGQSGSLVCEVGWNPRVQARLARLTLTWRLKSL